mgnify:FL=1
MKNIIEYYYNLQLVELQEKQNNYTFKVKNNNYILKEYNNNLDNINDIYTLNKYINNYYPIDKIILNKYNAPLTKVNNTYYILIKTNERKELKLSIISNLSNIKLPEIKSLERNNWEVLWSNMIDYYESQIGQNEKKYPLIRESFDYFIGLGENAISYLVNTKKEVQKEINDNKVLSHNNLYNSLYDPLNLIIDHKSRDVAEYIKISFFKNNKNIFKELDEYFFYNRYSLYGIRVLYARIIYPSFYFKLYDEIFREKKEEKELNKIISRVNEYEIYLKDIYLYLNKYYNIPSIEWLKKQEPSSRLQL